MTDRRDMLKGIAAAPFAGNLINKVKAPIKGLKPLKMNVEVGTTLLKSTFGGYSSLPGIIKGILPEMTTEAVKNYYVQSITLDPSGVFE